jgi:prolyl oligopeptidase
MFRPRFAIRTIAATALCAAALTASSGPPPTDKRPVTDDYHGTKVTDDYRWLENWNDAVVKTWSDAQNAYARSVLDKLPGVPAIRKRVTALSGDIVIR